MSEHHEHLHEHHHNHSPIHIDRHEGAVIGSVSGALNAADYDAAQKALAEAMEALGTAVNDAGGIVGHIKFVLSEQSRSCRISVTDDEASIRPLEAVTFRIDGAAIVFDLEEKALRGMINDTVGKLMPDMKND